MSAAGGVELLARGLATALSPLQRRLTPAEVRPLFAKLGLMFPPDLLTHVGFMSSLMDLTDTVAELPAGIDALAAAMETGDSAATVAAGMALITKFATLRDRLDSASSQLELLANALPGIAPADVVAFANTLPPKLLDLMVVEYLETTARLLVNTLALTGLVERHHDPGVPTDPAKPPFEVKRLRLDRVPQLLQSPASYAQALYGWGSTTFDGQRLLAQIADMADYSGLPAVLEPGMGGPSLDLFFFDLGVDPGVNPQGLRLDLRVPISQNFHRDVPLAASGWRLELTNDANLEAGLVAQIVPPSSVTLTTPTPALAGGLRAKITGGPTAPDTRMLIVGEAGGTRLEAASITAAVGATLEWDGSAGVARTAPTVEAEILGGQFVLSTTGGGDLLTALIPKDIVRATFDLGIGVVDGRLYLRGSAGLQASFPVHLSLGPVELQTITVSLAPEAGGIPVEISATVKAALGPLTMLVERIGLTTTVAFPSGANGNLGPIDLSLGFRAPTGIGLSLDAGPVAGGGYLSIDPTGRRYGGVLQFKLSFINVVAYGIYEQVDGQVDGRVAFVAVLGLRFSPGLQLGFGFALTGVGGLIGLNRRANVDALRERVASGAAGNVLFCEDPVKNAPTILGDLAAFFPSAATGFLVGPTLQISWLTPLVRLDIGILIELPGPSKIIILGSLRAVIGLDESRALLYLRMDVLGTIDFEQQFVSIDAALVNSHALGIVRLTGGMSFRLSYSRNPYILLSIGGFHPRFDPGPLNIPRLARIGASLDLSVVVVSIYVRLELYVGFTSNTLQTGARIEAGMDLGPLGVHGFFAFDALIQFRPFLFDLEFSAGFDVEVFGLSLCNVSINGRISGPGPVVIYARGSVKRLFLKASGSATFELGERNGDQPSLIASPVRELEPELRAVTNLRSEGDDPTVIRRPGRPLVMGVLVSPRGHLIWEQKRAPLKTIIHRLGGMPLAGQHQLVLDAPAGWTVTDERDWFNPGSFTVLDLKASQTLNNATFEELPSGVSIGSREDVHAEAEVPYIDAITLVKRPERTRAADLLVGAYVTDALHRTISDRTTTPAIDPGSPKVTVCAETADALAGDGTVVDCGQTPFQAFQRARQVPGRFAVPTADVAVDL